MRDPYLYEDAAVLRNKLDERSNPPAMLGRME